MRVAAITPPRKVHFHNSERFYWKIIVAESGVGGGRRRVLVAQTAYTAWPTPTRPQSLTHTHAAHTNTHTTETERERKVGSARFLSTRHSLFSVRMLVKNRKNAGRITSQSGGCGSRDAAPLFTFYTAFQLWYYMYVHMSLSAMCRRAAEAARECLVYVCVDLFVPISLSFCIYIYKPIVPPRAKYAALCSRLHMFYYCILLLIKIDWNPIHSTGTRRPFFHQDPCRMRLAHWKEYLCARVKTELCLCPLPRPDKLMQNRGSCASLTRSVVVWLFSFQWPCEQPIRDKIGKQLFLMRLKLKKSWFINWWKNVSDY